jgi:xylan 1,4-beta-xylosidase
MQRINFIRDSLLSTTGVFLIPGIVKAGAINAGTRQIVADAKAPGKKMLHFWSKCVGAGRASEGLRASWLEQLKLVKDNCGFEYCRFHGLFHDDMFVYREVNGKEIYNWQYVDDLFDRMLQIGVKPFVELGFVPKPMASNENTTFWWKGNTAPPKDYTKWAELVTAFTRHCIGRYGIHEVKTWYFEVWNEPDLKGFWNGTKSQYFELYKVSVNAIKIIDKDLRVGGPATSNFVPDDRFDGEVEDKTKHKTHSVADINTLEWRGVWIKDFLAYCAKEQLPVDFISTHPYPTDWAIDPESGKSGGKVRRVGATKEDLQWLQKTLAESKYPDAEVHLTEWSSSPSPRDAAHDSLQAAAYIIKVNIDCIGLAHSLSYWTFTDVFEEGGAGNSIFHGGFGMVNYQGIVKPAYHGYRMLHALGDEILQQEEGVVVTRHAKTGKLTALAYHYPSTLKNAISSNVQQEATMGTPKKYRIKLTGLNAGRTIVVETLDKDNGFAFPAWKKMGSPEPPTREQTKQLKLIASATRKEKAKADSKGQFLFERVVQPWECVLISEA